jgi:hypothetical protein
MAAHTDAMENRAKPIGSMTQASAYSLTYYPDGRVQTLTNGMSPETNCYNGEGLVCVRGATTLLYDGRKAHGDPYSLNFRDRNLL